MASQVHINSINLLLKEKVHINSSNQGLKFQTGVLAGQMHINSCLKTLNLGLKFKLRFKELICTWLAIGF